MYPWEAPPQLFRKERVVPTYWFVKMQVDVLMVGMLALSYANIDIQPKATLLPSLYSSSGSDNLVCNPSSPPDCLARLSFDQLKAYILFVGSCLYALEVMRSTELAWSIRQTILDHGALRAGGGKGRKKGIGLNGSDPVYAFYIAEDGRLPTSALDAMWGSTSWPSFVKRIVMTVANAIRFCALPVELALHRKRVNTVEVVQYLCFLPGVLLAVLLFPSLVIFLDERSATSPLEGVVVMLALRMMPMVSVEVVDQALRRSRTAAAALKPFTLPDSSLASRLVSSLRFSKGLVVNRDFEHEVGLDLEGVLYTLREALPRVSNAVCIHLKGYKQHEFESEDFRVQRRLIQMIRAIRKTAGSSVLIEGVNAAFIERLVTSPGIVDELQIGSIGGDPEWEFEDVESAVSDTRRSYSGGEASRVAVGHGGESGRTNSRHQSLEYSLEEGTS